MAKPKKAIKRIYQGEDGRWRLETTYTTGNVTAAVLDSKEDAERLLALSERFHGKYVLAPYYGQENVKAKVSNTGILHERDGSITDMLYLRYVDHNGTYLMPASKCLILDEVEVIN